MALTRKLLKGMGLTDEQIDTVIEAHAETVDGLKADIEKFKSDSEKLKAVQTELDEVKNAADDGYKEKYENINAEYEKYKQQIESEKTLAEKESVVKTYFESKGIKGKNLEIAMRGSGSEISGLELSEGKIKSTKALDDLISGTFSGLVETTETRGTKTPQPPNLGGKTYSKMTDEEYYKQYYESKK